MISLEWNLPEKETRSSHLRRNYKLVDQSKAFGTSARQLQNRQLIVACFETAKNGLVFAMSRLRLGEVEIGSNQWFTTLSERSGIFGGRSWCGLRGIVANDEPDQCLSERRPLFFAQRR